MRTVALIVAIALPSIAIAAGPHTRVAVGNWKGGSYTNDQTGAFTSCIASVPYLNGTHLYVMVTRQLSWNIGFSNPNWRLNPGERIPITFLFDGRRFDLGATAMQKDMVTVPMQDRSDLIGAFRHASLLKAFAQGSEFQFRLDGTSRLLPALVDCVKQNTLDPSRSTTSAVPSSLPAPRAEAGGPEATLFEVESLRAATNFLLRAQVSNAKMLDRTEFPVAMASYGAVWKSNDLLGAVKVIPTDSGTKGIDVAAAVTAADAKECKGTFASGRTSELVDSDVVFRGFSTCEDSSGLRSSQYFVVPRRKGGFIMFSVGAITSAGAAAPQTTKQERISEFTKAALVSVSD